ncbi:hypothetical protein DYB32_004676 [Aphanomyces invadans]|uniref:Uncharacterized protein n=1 Tax=Aphanomyces invadans TaxID=157072 RepID=A0A3R6VXP3_9STRA|nr:hypothetical protein DYB32_004676 [Aphanomyces invadans]
MHALLSTVCSYPLATSIDVFDRSKQNSRRFINLASSVVHLHDLSTLFIPFSPHSHDAGAIAWNSLSSVYRWPAAASFHDMLFRPNAKIMQLSTSLLTPQALFAMPPLDRVAHWDSSTTFPVFDVVRGSPRKFAFQCVTIRNLSPYTLAGNAGEPFDYWRSITVAKRLHSPESRPLAGSVASLSITDHVPKYLEHLAVGVKHVDPRVVHEFTQSGMNPDGIRDLHDDLFRLSDSSV